MVASESLGTTLTFNLQKIAFLGVCVALLYGASPYVAAQWFGERLPFLESYTGAFALSFFVAGLLAFPWARTLSFRFQLDESRVLWATMATTLLFVIVQISVYSSFEAAFISAYTERAGIKPEGGLVFLFSPVLMMFLACLSASLLSIAARGSRIHWPLVLMALIASLFIFGLGSRNSLLWAYSGLLGLMVSRMKYRSILLFAFLLYLVAVLFAYVRNNAILAFLFGVGDIVSPLTKEYFNPIVHEFGSSYRLFEMISSDPFSGTLVSNSPYGVFESIFWNMLPLAMKPSDFVSFTTSLSLMYASEGQGVGSSPMTELFFSQGASLGSIALVVMAIFWPPQYWKGWVGYRFLCVCLSIAVYFNFWRIGSAELLKMYFSFVVAFIVFGKFIKLRVVDIPADQV
jgi:hypothetical protein